MNYKAVIEKGNDGKYSIYVPDMKQYALNGQGDSVAEAKKDMLLSLSELVEMYQEDGVEIPTEINNPSFEYQYDMASVFDYFNWINVSKLAEKVGMNASLLRQYRSGLAFASEKQCEKIQTLLHQLGNELSTVKF